MFAIYVILKKTCCVSRSITRNDLSDFVSTHYKAPRMVLAGSGGVSHSDLVKLAEKHFSVQSNAAGVEIPITPNCRFTGELNFTNKIIWKHDFNLKYVSRI